MLEWLYLSMEMSVPSYTIYVVLAVTVFTIGIEIGPCFVYSCWFSKRDVTRDKELGVKKSFNYQVTIYWTYKWENSNK